MATRKGKGKAINKESAVVQEIRAAEKRLGLKLESRIDSSAQSLKDYSDVNTQSLKDYIDSRIARVDLRVENLDRKLDMKVVGLVELIERGFGMHLNAGDRLDDHERRLVVLESTRKN